MRIIAGEYRSRILKTLEGNNTRPTLDKIKGAVFSKFNNNIYDSIFLDLFSGSGSIGIEAISRGAKLVIFNDINNNAYNIINYNINNLNISNYELYKLDYKLLINKLDYKFNYIYLDPPFNNINYDELLEYISNSNIMNNNCYIIVESLVDILLKDNYNKLVKIKDAKYGKIKITYYIYNIDGE